jgi:hypothetical protein
MTVVKIEIETVEVIIHGSTETENPNEGNNEEDEEDIKIITIQTSVYPRGITLKSKEKDTVVLTYVNSDPEVTVIIGGINFSSPGLQEGILRFSVDKSDITILPKEAVNVIVTVEKLKEVEDDVTVSIESQGIASIAPEESEEEAEEAEESEDTVDLPPPVEVPEGVKSIFVSSSQGNDFNTGLSPEKPKKTLKAGYLTLRPDSNDALLLRRGDTWKGESLGADRWYISGASPTKRILVGSYGAGARPLLSGGNLTHISKDGSAKERADNLHLRDLHFEYSSRDPTKPSPNLTANGSGIKWLGAGNDITAENCVFRYFGVAISWQSYKGTYSNNVRFVRCLVLDSFSTNQHSQGAHIKEVDGLVIEECVFDRNGWSPFVAKANPTIFNHNVYLKECKKVVVVRSAFCRASSFGFKISSDKKGGADNQVLEDNLFVGNANGITFGKSTDHDKHDLEHKGVVCRGNIISHLGGAPNDRPQALGMRILSVQDALFERNLFLDTNRATGSVYALNVNDNWPHKNVTVKGNVAHRWKQHKGVPFDVKAGPQVTVSGNTHGTSGAAWPDPSRSVETFSGVDIGNFYQKLRDQKYVPIDVVKYLQGGFK